MLLHQTSPEKFQLGDKYTIFLKQIIGKGANAIVYKGQINRSSEPIAIKVIDTTQKWDSAQHALLQNQCNALRQVSHPNLLHLLEVVEYKGKFYLITKYYEGRTLQQYLYSEQHNQYELVNIFSQILEGASHLTAKNILHRDLKPTNIIITHNSTAIIIDFGYCQLITSSKMRVFNVGSPSFMAPEAYLRTLYSEKSESWSIAMILYFMLHGKLLDEGFDTKVYFERLKADQNFIINHIKKDLSNQLRELLVKGFKYDPTERISISAMKYLIDVLRIRNYKQQRQLSIASIPHHNIKPVIKFLKKQSINQQDTDAISPLKRRDFSAKQLPCRLSPAPKSEELVPQKKNEHYPPIIITTVSTTTSKPKPLGNEFFTSKINKGIFDSKRFSATQKIIESSPLKIASKNGQNYIRISPKQI